MENPQKNSTKNLIIGALSLLLVGSIFYNFKLNNDATSLTSMAVLAKSEKTTVLDDLNALKTTYDAAIAEKTTLSEELIAERDKIVQLIAQIETEKGNVRSLQKYKSQYFALESKMKNMLADMDALKKDNTKLLVQKDSIQVITVESKKANDNLVVQNGELNKTIEKASKLAVLNLKSVAYKKRSSGKKVDTEKASKADVINVSFTVAENQVAIPGERVYNIQVIDSKNNVIGEKLTENYGEEVLTYSFQKKLNYENKTVEVSEDLAVAEITSGTYFVNVFDKGQLVSKSSFELK
jgi:hypothetical protein